MLSDIVMVAIDVTNIEYYGKMLEEITRKSKPKNGTSTFISYITAHGIGHGSEITLDMRKFPKEDKLVDVLTGMLERLTRMNILKKGKTVSSGQGVL